MSENADRIPPVTADDIPEAIRDTPAADAAAIGRSRRKLRFWQWLGIAIATFLVTLGLNYRFGILVSRPPADLPEPEPVATAPSASSAAVPPEPEAEPSDDLLGHLPYEEAPRDALKALTADGAIRLRPAAADAFFEMARAARNEGIYLLPLSGFRSLEDQEFLFFEVKAQRGQVASQRAEVSAPPGYSEHHTGYAIDIGDADNPATHVDVSFEQTRAFEWLQQNAPYYSFELSFPKDNPQGVSYEPWHWRYVGDRHSLETFYKAKSTETEPR
ncbi:M15 family metallopeptidase [Lyngbya sp. CCY1209]|jgi:D-alanyl-D-alanine carboxypeptidase|uniref:M15 family metallopeptidase n=1 Tax=Lyngbya sp. CCY1209 TaxID=2886103 RepID=UPI002D1FC5B9|nr:M15 family metallopeptidase [Lyngbya sp. CCY1209]MEB3887202.1 D-alanyl-D-alanine carboxypeptidase family protein [Lyngbya sp. CCY1209]